MLSPDERFFQSLWNQILLKKKKGKKTVQLLATTLDLPASAPTLMNARLHGGFIHHTSHGVGVGQVVFG